MSYLQDVNDLASRNGIANRCFSKAVLAINAASAATVKTTNAIDYCVGGVIYQKAALAAQSIAVTHDARGNASTGYVVPANGGVPLTVYFTIGLNAAGTVAVAQSDFAGRDLSLVSAGTSARGNGLIADTPDGYTNVGVIKIVTNGTATFTAGTTALDAAGITASYFDIAVLPTTL